MKPEERENIFYKRGKENPINKVKHIAISLLPKTKGLTLDAGCGSGKISALLTKKGFDVIGVDFAKQGILRAKEKGVNAIYADLDKKLPFKNEYFDNIICTDVIEHVFDPFLMLSEFERILKPKGVLVLTAPNDCPLRHRIGFLLKGETTQYYVYRRMLICKHHTFFSVGLIKFMIKHSGFKIKKLIPKEKLIFNSERMVSWFSYHLIIMAVKQDEVSEIEYINP